MQTVYVHLKFLPRLETICFACNTETNQKRNAPAVRHTFPKPTRSHIFLWCHFDEAYSIIINRRMFSLKSAVIPFTFTEGDSPILRTRKIGKQFNASSTKSQFTYCSTQLMTSDRTIADSAQQDGCVTQSGYMSIDLLLDM